MPRKVTTKVERAEIKAQKATASRVLTDWARENFPTAEARHWFSNMTVTQQKYLQKNWDTWSDRQRMMYNSIMAKESVDRGTDKKWKTEDENHLVQLVTFVPMDRATLKGEHIKFTPSMNAAERAAKVRADKAKHENPAIYTVETPAQLTTVKGAFAGEYGPLVVRKYLAHFNPFEFRQSFSKEERDQILSNDPNEFQDFKNKMETPLNRTFLGTADKQPITVHALATCDQPLQIRVMGNIDAVRNLTIQLREFLQTPAIKEIIKADNPHAKGITIGFDKLEADKSNRNMTYCSNTLRSYVNAGDDHFPDRPIIKAWI